MAARTTAPIPTGFFNCEFYVGLKPYAEWKGAYRTKAELIAAINQKLPGVSGNHFQLYPARRGRGGRGRNRLEKLAGRKGLRAGPENAGKQGQSHQEDRGKSARHQGRHPGAGVGAAEPGGQNQSRQNRPLRPECRRHQRLDPGRHRRRRRPPRWCRAKSSSTWWSGWTNNTAAHPEQIGNILVATPDGQQIPLKEFADIQVENGASFIYRENNSRYIGVQFSVEGRDLAGAVNDARAQVKAQRRPARGLLPGLGRRIHRIHLFARPAPHHSAADAVFDLSAFVRALQQLEVPVHHRAGRVAVGAGGRNRGAVAD